MKNTPAAQNAEGAVVDEPRDLESLYSALNGLLAENKSLEEKNLELQEEMNALRLRSDRDKKEFEKYAISEFATDIICVADNIRHAIEAVPKERLGAIPALNSLVEGLEVTERSLLTALNRHRVTRFDPLGEPFNPHLHESKSMVSASDLPANTVAQVIHAGFMIGERLLRPAAVVVTQAGTAASQASESAAATDQTCDNTINIPNAAPAAQRAADCLTSPAFLNAAGLVRYALQADVCERGSSVMHKPIMTAAEGSPAANHPVCAVLNGKSHSMPEHGSIYAFERNWPSLPDEEAACEATEISLTSDSAKAIEQAHKRNKAVNDAFDSKNYEEAARLQEKIAAAVRRIETAAEGKPGDGTLGALLSLSWYQLFTGQYDTVIATADQAAAISKDYISIDTNRAHALMLMGSTDEASVIYNKHRGKETQNKKTWDSEVLDDFAEMEQANIKHPLMGEIRSAWASKN
jgi:molecular chaperone GrpE